MRIGSECIHTSTKRLKGSHASFAYPVGSNSMNAPPLSLTTFAKEINFPRSDRISIVFPATPIGRAHCRCSMSSSRLWASRVTSSGRDESFAVSSLSTFLSWLNIRDLRTSSNAWRTSGASFSAACSHNDFCDIGSEVGGSI